MRVEQVHDFVALLEMAISIFGKVSLPSSLSSAVDYCQAIEVYRSPRAFAYKLSLVCLVLTVALINNWNGPQLLLSNGYLPMIVDTAAVGLQILRDWMDTFTSLIHIA
jgi:hypothetical protein